MLCVVENVAVTQGCFARSKLRCRFSSKFLLVFHCNYLVPFLRYSTSNNGVPLKSGLGFDGCDFACPGGTVA